MINGFFLAPFLVFFIVLPSCVTLKNQQSHQHQLSGYDILSQKPHFALNKKESHYLFDAMLTQENISKLPKGIHRNKGTIFCRGDEDFQRCFLKLALDKPKIRFSKETPIQVDDYPKLIEYLNEIEAFQAIEHVIFDIDCHYLGPQSPPYGKEKLTCQIADPRFLDEFIVRTEIAKSISHKLIQEKGREPGIKTINGTIRCQIDGEKWCTIKAIGTNKSIQFNEKETSELSHEFQKTLILINEIQGASIKKSPTGFFASVQCHVSFSKQIFACRVKL